MLVLIGMAVLVEQLVNGAELRIRALECLGCRFRELNFPSSGDEVEDAEGTTGTEPAFSNLFEMGETVRDVALSDFVRQVEQMDGTGGVGDVDDNVADLAETVGAAVKAEELADGGGRVEEELARRDM